MQSALVRNDTIEGVTKEGAAKFVTYVPLGAASDSIKWLDDNGVDVEAPQPNNGVSVGDVLLTVLPMLLLIGAWFFFMRQMQSGRSRRAWALAAPRPSC